MADNDRSGSGLEIAEPETALLPGGDREATCPLLAALEQVRSALDRERAAAPAFFAELLALPPAEALERIRRDAHFQTWGLCELLLTKSAELDAATAAHFAALALAGAERLPPSRHAVAVVRDLKAPARARAGEAGLRRADPGGGEP